MTTPSGPLARKAAPAAAADTRSRPRRGVSTSNSHANAATIDQVMKKASGRSGNDCRASAAHPALVAMITPASRPVRSSYHRRAHHHASSARPRPESAAGNRAGASPTPGDDVGEGGGPVVQDGLLPAVLVVVPRAQPVAALDHLARRLGVEGLVGIRDRGPAEARDERETGDRGDEEHRAGGRGHERHRVMAVIAPARPSRHRTRCSGSRAARGSGEARIGVAAAAPVELRAAGAAAPRARARRPRTGPHARRRLATGGADPSARHRRGCGRRDRPAGPQSPPATWVFSATPSSANCCTIESRPV
jgi:hypothetical protein